jgi:hypothetical protein
MSEEPSGERPAAGVRAPDAEREAVVARLHGAVAGGRIDLDEFGERVQAAYAAITTADLTGLWEAGAVSSVFGDVRLVPGAAVPERVSTVSGDVEVLVAEGVAAEIEGWTVFGDRRTRLAAGVNASQSSCPKVSRRARRARRSTG